MSDRTLFDNPSAVKPSTLEVEEWRPVVGYEGLYEVSSLGHVRRPIEKRHGVTPGRIMKLRLNMYGYAALKLRPSRGADPKYVVVHRLVAAAFIGPEPTPKHEVNHIDGVKNNNRVTNLEWVTRSENIKHAHRMGLASAPMVRGQSHYKTNLTAAEVIEMRSLVTAGMRQIDVAKLYGITKTAMFNIYRRKTWAHI